MSLKEVNDKKPEGNEKFLDIDENHKKHLCIDEFLSYITDSFDTILRIWNKKDLGCKTLKKEISRLISESDDQESLLANLDDLIDELNDIEDDKNVE